MAKALMKDVATGTIIEMSDGSIGAVGDEVFAGRRLVHLTTNAGRQLPMDHEVTVLFSPEYLAYRVVNDGIMRNHLLMTEQIAHLLTEVGDAVEDAEAEKRLTLGVAKIYDWAASVGLPVQKRFRSTMAKVAHAVRSVRKQLPAE